MKVRHLALWSAALLCLLPVGCGQRALKIKGAGSSFVAPILERWLYNYRELHPRVKPSYNATGSSAGKKEFTDGWVTFAASDAYMKREEAEKVKGGVVQIPVTAGSIVLAYNLEGIDNLKLPRDVYPAIFLGQIQYWDDPRIQAANPGVNLPSLRIIVVVRSDGSGTTFAVTSHLSAISEEFKNGPGVGTTVVWPRAAQVIASPRNPGVAGSIRNNPGTIGYVEYEFAHALRLTAAALQNHDLEYVKASPETGNASLASLKKVPDDFDIKILDPVGKDCYPIVTCSWLLLSRRYAKPEVAETVKSIVTYCLTEGQKISTELGYLVLPDTIVEPALQAVKDQIGHD